MAVENPVNNLEELTKLNQERVLAGEHAREVTGILAREKLNQVRIVIRDKTLPISGENATVYLNGQLLPLVKSVNLMVDAAEKIGIARLDLYAHFTVEEEPINGPSDTPKLS